MKITGIAPWFGSKRTLAPTIVQQLGTHSYYFQGCCGSMSELFAKAPSEHETVCDLHGALTNLAWVVQDEHLAVQLFNRLQRVLYSDEIYLESKKYLDRQAERGECGRCGQPTDLMGGHLTEKECLGFRCSVERAYHYFIASWMGRNGVAGTARVNYQIATRWTQGGGSGPLRFRSAVDSIPAWCERLRNVHILRRDLFEVLPKIEDAHGVAITVDPPYLPDTVSGNSKYLHDFANGDHERLAKELGRFRKARVVVSYYASPQLAGLYPGWTQLDCSRQKHLAVQNKRGSGRKEAPETLLINGPPFTDSNSLF